MVYQSRIRKRVHAIRRAPDGSAFQTCDKCGVSVAIALVDMHECNLKVDVNVKRLFKGSRSTTPAKNSKQQFRLQDQPRSGFRFFMESFMKSCEAGNEIDLDRNGFETWKNMSQLERNPYVLQAEKVNNAYTQALLKEEEEMSTVDDEANSAMVGKLGQKYEDYENDDNSDYSSGYESQSDVSTDSGFGFAPAWHF